MRIVALIISLVLMLGLPAVSSAHSTKASWTAFDAEQRLTIGKFAAASGIAYATCLGTGVATNRASEFGRRYKHFECKVQSKGFENERQVVIHVRSETMFTPQWLTTKECT